MHKTFAAQAVPFTLAAALTLALFATTSLLARHEYRAAAAQVTVAAAAQHAA